MIPGLQDHPPRFDTVSLPAHVRVTPVMFRVRRLSAADEQDSRLTVVRTKLTMIVCNRYHNRRNNRLAEGARCNRRKGMGEI